MIDKEVELFGLAVVGYTFCDKREKEEMKFIAMCHKEELDLYR